MRNTIYEILKFWKWNFITGWYQCTCHFIHQRYLSFRSNGLKMIAVYFRVIHKQTFSDVSVQFTIFWFGSVGNWMLALGLSAKALVVCSDTEAHGEGSSISVISSLTAPFSGVSSSSFYNRSKRREQFSTFALREYYLAPSECEQMKGILYILMNELYVFHSLSV